MTFPFPIGVDRSVQECKRDETVGRVQFTFPDALSRLIRNTSRANLYIYCLV